MSKRGDISARLIARLKKPSTLEEITHDFKVPFKQLRSTIAELREQGYQIEKTGKTYYLNLSRDEENTILIDLPSHFKFALFGDTHLGSKHTRTDFLNEFYETGKKEGVGFYAHAGDLIQGVGIFPTEASELKDFTIDDQMIRVNEEYPKSDLTTYLIWGNHDLKQFEKGRSPHPRTALERPEIVHVADYLGRLKGRRTNITIDLFHPAFGHSYARCFSEDTEILTENGWKIFKDLRKDESVATLDKNLSFEWQKPIAHTIDEFNGNLLNFKARSFDLLVTPDHRMFVKRYDRVRRKSSVKYPKKARHKLNYSWQFKTAEELEKEFTRKQAWQMIRTSLDFKHTNNQDISDDWIKFYAWYVSEGCCVKRSNRPTIRTVSISQCPIANPDKWEEINQLFLTLFGKVNVSGMNFNRSDKQLADSLCSNFGRTSKEKRLPYWLKNLPKAKLKLFLETLIKGDGWIDEKGFGYRSYSDRLLNDVQEIAIKCGYGATKREGSIRISLIQNFPTINSKPKKVKYSGKVYCVSVPNQIILVRRNGRAIWSGNSYHLQRHIDQLNPKERPSILGQGHQHDSMYFYHGGVHAFKTATFQGASNFSKRLSMHTTMGGWIVEGKHDGNKIRELRPRFIHYEG